MKPILLILSALFLSLASIAQIPLDSFYKDGTRWKDIYYTVRTPTSHDLIKKGVASEYLINGDTIVNGLQYKKFYYRIIYSKTISTITGTSETQPTPYQLMGRLRVDNRKVYFADDRTNVSSPYIIGKDYLMYDFGVAVGDTFYYDYSELIKSKIIITKIDTITINSGQQIKRYNYGQFNAYYLEGIGFYGGFLTSKMHFWVDMSPVEYEMLCYQSDNLLYKTGNKTELLNWYLLENCYDENMLKTPQVSASVNNLLIIPNPSSGFFLIKGFSESSQTSISVYNNIGQKVFDKTVTGRNIDTEVLINNSIPGIYTISIHSGDFIKHEKLIIQ